MILLYINLHGIVYRYLDDMQYYDVHNTACTRGCAVLLCLVCLFDLACFFLSSFSSLI